MPLYLTNPSLNASELWGYYLLVTDENILMNGYLTSLLQGAKETVLFLLLLLQVSALRQ
jgi:hypothetical protein